MKPKKNFKIILWAVMVAVCIYNVYHVFLLIREEDNTRKSLLIENIYAGITEQAIAVYLPGLLYESEREKKEEIILEDESTCESIIETKGRTIAERLLEENQAQAIQQENEQAKEKQKEEEQKEKDTKEKEEDKQEKNEEPVVAQASPLLDLSMERLANFDYLLNNFFVVDPNTTVDNSKINAETFMNTDLTIKGEATSPQILIYHTHSQEEFIDSVEGDTSTGVIGLGDYLAEILTDTYGYNVIHDTQTFDMAGGSIDRNKAYNYAREGIQKVLEENPSVDVIIDLHRDGVSEDKHLVTDINGKPTAQIMYFNGLSYTNNGGILEYLNNPYISDNLAFSFRLEYESAQYYPTLTRCVYLKGYRYNLDLRPKSILLEVGAQTNTVEEARNAMEPFAYILNKVLKGE